MKSELLNRMAERGSYWHAWLDGFITAEVVALILLITYCLAHTF